MPATLTYPGVYIEEIASGVRTITGVATSIAAFIGQALRGPVNEPIVINNFSDFERTFGGLAADSTLSYAVRDFYVNGGSQALIIRLINGATAAAIPLPTGAAAPNDLLPLLAATPGSWGNKVSATVDYATKDADAPSPDANLFNLTITGPNGAIEKFLNVSVAATDPRYVARVLEQSSALVSVQKDASGNALVPNVRPSATTTAATPNSGSDGNALTSTQYLGSATDKTGINALEKADLFNLLCIPPAVRGGDTDNTVYQAAMAYCADRRALLLVDPPEAWSANKATAAATAKAGLSSLGLNGPAARNAALYFPRVIESDPQRDGQLDSFVPCGMVAGVMARTDAQRGVWKAPAGLDASLNGSQALDVNLTDDENGLLNPLGINCLRAFPVTGRVVWGARTLRGADQLADEYKYVPVRRLALFMEESLYRGTQWVVFEPNDEPLWSQIRLNIGGFMNNLFRQGAFQGKTPREAYFVKCDKETTTQNDINLGIVNIVVGFAPLKPAEFVVIQIQQMAGQLEV
ncbi:MAG: phage tail sheath subtilisin-like domain-containing protein [Chloroflexi bacterium]|nr:phage tail sheath subtilisin-like domain-containing protein [Chloroflexota bacterium]